MVWLTVDKDGTENMFFDFKPTRFKNYWVSRGYFITLSNGAIKKHIGKKLTWDDEPVEI